jgi:hypothetical protein
MSGRIWIAVLLAALWCAPGWADVATLKDTAAPGYTYCDTQDTQIERSNSSLQYQVGGTNSFTLSWNSGSGGSPYTCAVVRFDLGGVGALAGTTAVNSATLRLYQLSGADAGTIKINRMTQAWTEGRDTSDVQSYNWIFDGANCYARQPGVATKKADLIPYVHNTVTLYYIDGVTSLVSDPAPAGGSLHYIRRDTTSEGIGIRNYAIANYLLKSDADLDALAAETAATDAYFYDDAADRIYLRNNGENIMYFRDEDVWADFPTRAVVGGSCDLATTFTDSDGQTAGWYEVDITSLVQDWLLNSVPNDGVRVANSLYNASAPKFASADASVKWDPVNLVWEGQAGYDDANGIYVQPELVIDYTVPEPATLCLLTLGAPLGLIARRRRRK